MFPFRALLSAQPDALRLDLSILDLAADRSNFDDLLDYIFDFDSLIVPITTLGVLRGRATINYRPNFFTVIDQN